MSDIEELAEKIWDAVHFHGSVSDVEKILHEWQADRAQGGDIKGRVAIPRDVAEAKGMYLVGYSWLKHNAPDELKP